MTDWINAPQKVIDLAQDLVDQYHPELQQARIGILFRSEAPVSNGKATWGQALKVDGKWKPLLTEELDFIIWLAFDVWDSVLDTRQKRALLDHELCHCKMTRGEPKLRAHDIEEFTEIVHRHGLWRDSMKQFADAIQGKLPIVPPVDTQGFVRAVVLQTAKEINESPDEVDFASERG